MLVVAQAGVGAAGGGVGAIIYVLIVSVFVLIAFTVAWISFPIVVRFIWNVIRRRHPMAESDADRRMDGRLFSTGLDPDQQAEKNNAT
ncbi:MAG: hypothetical protein HKN47_17450 [Pirellulaceae bacterium]|nr:hypothetical protein [Pirellulaceae bacterium]